MHRNQLHGRQMEWELTWGTGPIRLPLEFCVRGYKSLGLADNTENTKKSIGVGGM